MSKSIEHQTLVVVADGGKAILFRNTGHGGTVTLKEERRISPKDLVNDGPSGSRPEEQSPKQTGEATFAKHLAEILHQMHDHHDYTSLVLAADPQTLGQIRGAMHKTVEGAVVKTLSKDLTNSKVADIEHSIAA